MKILKYYFSSLKILIIILIFSINSLKETDLDTIAKTVSSNLISLTWKKTIGFNYTDTFQSFLSLISPKDSLLLTLFKIQPLINFSSPYELIDTSTETSIVFPQVIINYRFNMKLNLTYERSNMTIDYLKENLFASQTIYKLKFKKNLESKKFILKYYDNSDINILSKSELLDSNFYKNNKNILNNEIKNILQKCLENYFNEVIFYYPTSDIQKKFYNMIEYLLSETFIFNTKIYYFRRIEFLDFTYEIDEKFVYRNVVCEINFLKQVNQKIFSNYHINIEYIIINEKGVELGNISNDLGEIIDFENKFCQGVQECFDDAFKNTYWD